MVIIFIFHFYYISSKLIFAFLLYFNVLDIKYITLYEKNIDELLNKCLVLNDFKYKGKADEV